jgi:hypothetical protein
MSSQWSHIYRAISVHEDQTRKFSDSSSRLKFSVAVSESAATRLHNILKLQVEHNFPIVLVPMSSIYQNVTPRVSYHQSRVATKLSLVREQMPMKTANSVTLAQAD